MPKRSILLIGIPVAAMAIMGLVMVLTPEREPEYGGKKLSEWATELGRSDGTPEARAAAAAVKQMGTNTLPYLREWVGYEPPKWKRQLSRAGRTLRNQWLQSIYQTE